ncbi:NADH-quinone oxidoreductase subunit L [Escherichia coli]|nr:NADH-quinone oxidoreductase subunit L [Escherichia coli]
MNMLALTIILPLIGFVLLAFSRGRWSENVSAIVGVGSVGLAALVTAFIGVDFFANGEQSYSQPLWTWMSVGDFNIGFNLVLDGLSLTMLSVVTGVGFLIHMYASWYMRGEEGYSRFFAYTNLFIASMVVLVLADNLLLMYLGWEGVGLCSYLLIGFYYTDPKNGAAAMKAFVVTRVGDVFLAFALFILYNELGTLNFREMVELAPAHFADGNNMLMWATLMLLGGAVGKSAQLPLQTWLADAMAGPTPVSALIPRCNDGNRGCLPDRPYPRPVPDDPGSSASGGYCRGGYAAAGRFCRAGTDRHQTCSRLLYHEPDWLHVPRAWRAGMGCGDFPLDDSRVL